MARSALLGCALLLGGALGAAAAGSWEAALALALGGGAGAAAVGWSLLRRMATHQRALLARREREHLQLMNRVAALIAHELKNPLASAKGRAQLLEQMAAGEEPLQRRAHRVVEELVRIERLAEQLIEFIHSSRIQREPCDPRQLVRDVADRVADHLDVIVDTRAAPERWELDPRAMERALLGLLSSRDEEATGRRKTLHLVLRARRGTLQLLLREAAPEDVVLPGHSPLMGEGSLVRGLGLAASREIVRAHGGEVSITRSRMGRAVVEICLPG